MESGCLVGGARQTEMECNMFLIVLGNFLIYLMLIQTPKY